MKGCFHTGGLSLDLSMFDPKLLCSRTMPRHARKGGAQEVRNQQCPNKEAGCHMPISSSVLHGRCWSRKMGKMIVVGDSKKKTPRLSAETLQTAVNKSRLAGSSDQLAAYHHLPCPTAHICNSVLEHRMALLM